jgi:hypothetical protein
VEDWKSVPIGSSVGQNETANTHWLHERTNRRQEPEQVEHVNPSMLEGLNQSMQHEHGGGS